MAIDGTPTTVTLTSTDPEGFPLTWSSSVSGDAQVGTVTNTDNVFTITPSTDTADAGTLSVTFSVTDGSNTENSTSTFTLVFVSPLWDETVLSIGTSSTDGLANGTFIDRSTNAHTVTPTGSPVQTPFHPYLENWSFLHTSGSNVVSTQNQVIVSGASSSDFALGTGDYTIEFWFKRNSTSGKTEQLFQIGSSTTGGPSVLWYSNNSLYFQRYPGSSNLYTGVTGAGFVAGCLDGQWHHFAGVRDNTGTSSHRFYIDGKFIKSVTTGSTDYTTNNDVFIGDGQYGQFDGYISNVRVTKGAALYTGGSTIGDVVFTPPEAKLTTAVSGGTVVLLTAQSNRFIDNSASGHTVSQNNGYVEINQSDPFGRESEYAAGENKGSVFLTSNNQLEPITGSIVDVGTGDYTVEFWCYGVPNDDIVIDMRNGTSNTTGAMLMSKSTGFRYQSGSTATTVNGPDPALKQWLHVAVVRSSGNVTCYANGVGESLLTGDTTNFTSTSIAIGSSNTNGYDVVDGYVSDLKITKSAVYTANFTPPTAPVGNTNASLYLPMDNAGIFDKTGNHTLTPAGNASTSTTQTKYADTSIYFDGTGDYIVGETLDDFSGDFTWEVWAYPISHTSGTTDVIASTYLNSTDGITFGIFSTTGKYYFAVAGDANQINDTNNLSLNTWTHLAGVRSGSTVTFYVNGTSVGTTTKSGVLTSTSNLHIGTNVGGGALSFNGYIENFQILNGVAKYTANFTPPAQTQGLSYQAES